MTMRKRLRILAFLSLLPLGLALAPSAWGQPSGRQTTPDGRHVLVNRAESGLQWAISYSPLPGTITGNVFDPAGGDPNYIWCDRVGDDGVLDPAAIEISWQCEGADACTQSPCDASGWTGLGTVPLGGFFFLPARDPFVTLQQPGQYCDPIRFGISTDLGTPSWEVDTSVCPYASMTQPTQTAVDAGEDIYVRVWNWQLDDPVGGSLAFTLMLGDEVIYSEYVPIPKDAGLLGPVDSNEDPLAICIRPENAAPAGTQVSWNVQLHPTSPTAPEASADDVVDSIPELGRPLHSTPGVVHMIEMTVGSNCEGEPAGRRLVTNDTWQHVSAGLPPLP